MKVVLQRCYNNSETISKLSCIHDPLTDTSKWATRILLVQRMLHFVAKY
jgi:hypothetical protein